MCGIRKEDAERNNLIDPLAISYRLRPEIGRARGA